MVMPDAGGCSAQAWMPVRECFFLPAGVLRPLSMNGTKSSDRPTSTCRSPAPRHSRVLPVGAKQNADLAGTRPSDEQRDHHAQESSRLARRKPAGDRAEMNAAESFISRARNPQMCKSARARSIAPL